MPLGPYKTFGECVGAQRKKGKSEESANAICGQIEKNTKEGLKRQGESIRYDDTNGHLYIKAFLLDASTNINRWGVNPDSFNQRINSFIGKPLVLTENFRHPMPPEMNRVGGGELYDDDDNPNNTVNTNEIVDHWLQYQEIYRVGSIIDITEKKGTYYAIIEVTDPSAKEAFRNNDVPLFVSPAIAQLDPFEDASNITNWTGIHLAIVANPAYTIQKAVISGQCHDNKDRCLLQLRQAAIEEERLPRIGCGFCRTGALARYAEIVKSWRTHHNVVITKDPRDLINSSIEKSDTHLKTELTDQNQQDNNNSSNQQKNNNANTTTTDTNKSQEYEKVQSNQGGDLGEQTQKGNPTTKETTTNKETETKETTTAKTAVVDEIAIKLAGMNECIQIFQQNGIQDPQQATQICKLAAQAFAEQNPNNPAGNPAGAGGQQQGAPRGTGQFGSIQDYEKEIAKFEAKVADLQDQLKGYKKSDKTEAQRIAELEETVTNLNKAYKEKELEAYLITKIADEELRTKKIKRFAELNLPIDDVKDIYENLAGTAAAVKPANTVKKVAEVQQNDSILSPRVKLQVASTTEDNNNSGNKTTTQSENNPVKDRNLRIISSLLNKG